MSIHDPPTKVATSPKVDQKQLSHCNMGVKTRFDGRNGQKTGILDLSSTKIPLFLVVIGDQSCPDLKISIFWKIRSVVLIIVRLLGQKKWASDFEFGF